MTATNAQAAFRECFGGPRALIGVLHVGALPGTPSASHSIDTLIRQTLAEARVYRDAGFAALVIENMHDRPYLNRAVGPEVTAAMTAIGREVRREVALPLGVQVLAGANREALAVALNWLAVGRRGKKVFAANVVRESFASAEVVNPL